MTTTVTAAEFNQRPSRVKRAAAEHPVIITEHNRPSFVLMTYVEFERLQGAPDNLASWLEMEDDVDFDIEEVGLDVAAAEL
ncbi:type II toxin-antitoxin system Phd/YefM family antitoxin [Nocardioides sp. AE5]|uniref:type II toxin-antitoxin system Phd/YefM family antitoxin n=1 Tax=Nocardioides sp. AE5 TaxID=2962573 RepID=UPI0028818F3E|nr:type II toxin-antitoxin system Phd/YefM family antitoxin [Nocardioides sp. AE5]MDT0202207.1 type II toxin-antitoxin system Phd/YefM family antitoxin [Nocardioides sp. AE5]